VALIIDTGPLYASLDRHDRDHKRCRRLIEAADEELVIPQPVLPEVDYLVSTRMGPGPMVALLRDIEAGAYRVDPIVRDEYPRIREIMDRYSDADIGFVDASVLVLAERLREPKIATLDRKHFSLVRPVHVEALEILPA
jgi:predicted nucleic acid-binding protein